MKILPTRVRNFMSNIKPFSEVKDLYKMIKLAFTPTEAPFSKDVFIKRGRKVPLVDDGYLPPSKIKRKRPTNFKV